MINKKSQVNKVFVYTFSIIVVIFCSYLAVKFILTFSLSTQDVIEKNFYNELEKDYNIVSKTYSSKKVFRYKVPSSIKHVCFVQEKACIDDLDSLDELSSNTKEQTKLLFENDDNIVLYDMYGILSSKHLSNFNVNNDCFCLEPSSNGYFKLDLENKKNNVWITQVDN